MLYLLAEHATNDVLRNFHQIYYLRKCEILSKSKLHYQRIILPVDNPHTSMDIIALMSNGIQKVYIR